MKIKVTRFDENQLDIAFIGDPAERHSMIAFARHAYDAVIEHAYRGRSMEVCGVLAGDFDPEHSVVRAVYEAENVAADPEIRYEMDPEEQLALLESIEADGDDVVGFYHSHPTGPTGPSATDAAQATWPGYTYAICSLDGYPYLGAWRCRDTPDEQAPNAGEVFDQELLTVRASHELESDRGR